jgi:DUF2075 family protein
MGHLFDFTEEEFGFNMRWNMKSYGGKWIIEPDSVNEIGCIHTAQGLDIDYIGVIIGNDLVIRNGEVVVNPAARDSEDKTISGWVTGMQRNPAKWKPLLETIIKNTYRTLMTRGLKGCYIHSIDVETNQYLKNLLSKQPAKS